MTTTSINSTSRELVSRGGVLEKQDQQIMLLWNITLFITLPPLLSCSTSWSWRLLIASNIMIICSTGQQTLSAPARRESWFISWFFCCTKQAGWREWLVLWCSVFRPVWPAHPCPVTPGPCGDLGTGPDLVLCMQSNQPSSLLQDIDVWQTAQFLAGCWGSIRSLMIQLNSSLSRGSTLW